MARPAAKGERSLGLFALGLVIFNPPLLSIFSIERLPFGLPLLYLFLFAAWALLIVMMALNARSRDEAGPSKPEPGSAPPEAARNAPPHAGNRLPQDL